MLCQSSKFMNRTSPQNSIGRRPSQVRYSRVKNPFVYFNTFNSAVPFGVPNPVQASQPGPAEYPPLFPLVMS
jgi:hypothetical protein